ncbi:MAG: aspartate/glutamate racemase family protein [Hyphomonadaceae bacterium]|nr:aspartate/glutamate racemase family protein [Hyphomonadaceae bacterium]
MKRVLVFDSGVGGLSVLDAIASADMALELDFLADAAWLPYGLKADADVAARVPELIAAVAAEWRPDLVVIACNTASTIALAGTRAALPHTPVVGVVPPIKPAAAATQTGTFAILATPATIRRPYTLDLIAQFAADKNVIRVGSSVLVEAGERKLRGLPVDKAAVAAVIDEMFQAPGGERIDVVALSCTHFPLLLEELTVAAPQPCLWVDSGEAIARRVRALLDPQAGRAVARRAGFTTAAAARDLHGAFAARGFAEFVSISADAPFVTTPLP